MLNVIYKLCCGTFSAEKEELKHAQNYTTLASPGEMTKRRVPYFFMSTGETRYNVKMNRSLELIYGTL